MDASLESQDTTPQLTYHSRARLPDKDQEAILIDTGAYDGLTGDEWVGRQSAHAKAHGHTPQKTPLAKPMKVQGVGKFPQEVTEATHMPGVLEDGTPITVDAPVVPDSPLPCLAGLKTLERLEAVVDCRRNQRKLYLGKDIDIKTTKATKVLQLYPAVSGHLMLPISHFDRLNKREPLQLYGNSSSSNSPPQQDSGMTTFQ